MNKYSELTDKQIEKLIDQLKETPTDFGLYIDEYCTSWEHTGPLSLKNGISFTPAELTLDGKILEFWVSDQNGMASRCVPPSGVLRAICECVLMINDRSE